MRATPLPRRRAGAALVAPLALALLAACEPAPPPAAPEPPPPAPVAAPAPEPDEAPAPPPPEPSDGSRALATYYARLQADLLSQGLLRGDSGAEDAPFTDEMLARDFLRIALFDEYVENSATELAAPAGSRLRRWDAPVRWAVEFGPAVPPAQAARDRAGLGAYAARLSRLTGVPFAEATGGDANLNVLVLSEDDRTASADRLRALSPGISEAMVREVVNLSRSTYCLVYAYWNPETWTYRRATVVIRAELPELLRTACIHEELAQGLGLVNDSPQARPSIFNDNDEFGRLTGHDELLLRMLYDPRMRPGMTLEEAEPVAREVARELVGGGPA